MNMCPSTCTHEAPHPLLHVEDQLHCCSLTGWQRQFQSAKYKRKKCVKMLLLSPSLPVSLPYHSISKHKLFHLCSFSLKQQNKVSRVTAEHPISPKRPRMGITVLGEEPISYVTYWPWMGQFWEKNLFLMCTISVKMTTQKDIKRAMRAMSPFLDMEGQGIKSSTPKKQLHDKVATTPRHWDRRGQHPPAGQSSSSHNL